MQKPLRERQRYHSTRLLISDNPNLDEVRCYVDAATGVRRHSIAASVNIARVATNNPTTTSHSTDPSCWSGSHPDKNSIQSGNTGVIKAKMPVATAKPLSTQNRRRRFALICHSINFRRELAEKRPRL